MAFTKADDQILKTDVLGRVKTPADRREKLLDEFEKSGLSGAKFAEMIGVKYQTFATWAQRRRRQRKQYPVKGKSTAKPLPQLQWFEAVVEKQPPSANLGVLVIHLPCGARVEVADASGAALAALLLRSMEGKTAC
jgi:hypothetical protein